MADFSLGARIPCAQNRYFVFQINLNYFLLEVLFS